MANSRFFDPALTHLTPYTPGEQPASYEGIAKLNTNESPFPPSPAVVEAAHRAAGTLHLYPAIGAGPLRAALAGHLGVRPANLTVSNGSDELLAFLFQALCPKGAVFADLTYGFYPVYAQLYGVAARVLPLREDFTLAAEDYLPLHETIVIANPNAPTGLALAAAEVERLLAANPDRLVVVDEAYVEFGAESCVPLLSKYDNLLVVGTFSKSRSLAGARLGYAVGGEALIADLDTIRFSFNPYNVNAMTQAAGLAAIEDSAYYAKCTEAIVATRARCTAALEKMGFACTDSRANFIFASHPGVEAKTLYLALKERGILVRWFDRDRIRNHLRISVGSDVQMDRLLAALMEIVAAASRR